MKYSLISDPIVDAFFIWLYDERQLPEISQKNQSNKVFSYVLERKAELNVFLSNSAMPIDTNHLERALRIISMGRK